MLTALAALLVTIAVMLLALRWLGRMQGVPRGTGRGGELQLLERLATGPRQGVGLLRVGERVLIVGLADEISVLGELSPDESGRVLDDTRMPARPATPTWLGGIGLVLAFVVLPVAMQAQVVTAPPPAVPTGAAAGPTTPIVQGPGVPSIDLRVGSGD